MLWNIKIFRLSHRIALNTWRLCIKNGIHKVGVVSNKAGVVLSGKNRGRIIFNLHITFVLWSKCKAWQYRVILEKNICIHIRLVILSICYVHIERKNWIIHLLKLSDSFTLTVLFMNNLNTTRMPYCYINIDTARL